MRMNLLLQRTCCIQNVIERIRGGVSVAVDVRRNVVSDQTIDEIIVRSFVVSLRIELEQLLQHACFVFVGHPVVVVVADRAVDSLPSGTETVKIDSSRDRSRQKQMH